jgi:hypothetical protein
MPDTISTRRCHAVQVSAHEKLLLEFYRTVDLTRRTIIDNLLWVWWRGPLKTDREAAVARRRRAGRALGTGTLPAAHLMRFRPTSSEAISSVTE